MAYGLVQLGTHIDWYQGSRIASTFTHPNIFAFYLLTTIGLIFTLLASDHLDLSQRMEPQWHSVVVGCAELSSGQNCLPSNLPDASTRWRPS